MIKVFIRSENKNAENKNVAKYGVITNCETEINII